MHKIHNFYYHTNAIKHIKCSQVLKIGHFFLGIIFYSYYILAYFDIFKLDIYNNGLRILKFYQKMHTQKVI